LKIAVTAHIITSREGEYPLRLSRHHDPQGSGEAARKGSERPSASKHRKLKETDMHCPHCTTNLLMTERQGVEIDYCPTCRGVWLDRGELDKLIERSGSSKPQVKRDYDDDDDDDFRLGRWSKTPARKRSPVFSVRCLISRS
jgi:Zn-finger nucleic acid-binding protein